MASAPLEEQGPPGILHTHKSINYIQHQHHQLHKDTEDNEVKGKAEVPDTWTRLCDVFPSLLRFKGSYKGRE